MPDEENTSAAVRTRRAAVSVLPLTPRSGGTYSAPMQNISEAEQTARRILELVAALGRLCSLRDPMMQAIEDLSLTPTQFHAHQWIGLDGPLTMGELARRVGVSEKTVTGVVDRLERQGLVKRDRLETDRRVVEVKLTGEGRKLWSKLEHQIVSRTTFLLSALPGADRRALVRIIERLVERFAEPRSDA